MPSVSRRSFSPRRTTSWSSSRKTVTRSSLIPFHANGRTYERSPVPKKAPEIQICRTGGTYLGSLAPPGNAQKLYSPADGEPHDDVAVSVNQPAAGGNRPSIFLSHAHGDK